VLRGVPFSFSSCMPGPMAGGGSACYLPPMIVRPRPSAFGLLFILRGSIVPMIAPRVLVVLVFSAIVAGLHHAAPQHFRELTPAPFTLLGLALSIFLGFRNNACYERWWEGRRQWGQLVAETGLPGDWGCQAAIATCEHRSLAGWNRCPKPEPSVPL